MHAGRTIVKILPFLLNKSKNKSLDFFLLLLNSSNAETLKKTRKTERCDRQRFLNRVLTRSRTVYFINNSKGI